MKYFVAKIDVQNIGIAGYSQGGVGAVRVVAECENTMPDNVFKLCARVAGAEHVEMQKS